MKRLSALFIAVVALCLNACEQHKAHMLPGEYHTSDETKVAPGPTSSELSSEQ